MGLSLYYKPNPILVAVSLTLLLTAAGLVYYWMLPLPGNGGFVEEIHYGFITIDGDANFSDTALLEGWPGDGSPENPFIIDGLDIDISDDDNYWYCIKITNTQLSFIISNCSLSGAIYNITDVRRYRGAGIFLENVTNCELVKNIIDSDAYGIRAVNLNSSKITDNICYGGNKILQGFSKICSIYLVGSTYNTIANNTCNDSEFVGIRLSDSSYNIVANNTCNGNGWRHHRGGGIYLKHSHANIVANNTCNDNIGEDQEVSEESLSAIHLEFSDSNSVSNNTCNRNEWGITLHESKGNTVINNTCNNNTRGIYLYESGLLDWGHWGTDGIVANNTCNGNHEDGIQIQSSFGVIVANNTCNSNEWGIYLGHSEHITVASNTCNNNSIGIYVQRSDELAVTRNTCTNNRIGIFLYYSDAEGIASNTYWGNTEHDLVGET